MLKTRPARSLAAALIVALPLLSACGSKKSDAPTGPTGTAEEMYNNGVDALNARRFATAVSQAPGLAGMPSRGHCIIAETNASCANSSARSMSRVIRVSVAISRGDSTPHKASTAR